MNLPLLSIDNASISERNQQLAMQMAEFYADPLGHVLYSYPWGQGSLQGRNGPMDWQKGFLIELGQEVRARKFDGVNAVEPIQFSTASGHGIGKSALVAHIIKWIMDTRPFAKGTVTANTAPQLRSKTWAELAKWHNLSITKHWFTLTSGQGSLSMYHKEHPEQWRVDGQTCREENSEAFAGQHAVSSTSFYIFDEASAVPDKIYEVREGGLTDGEPMTFDFGNPTRNSGRFFQNMKGRFRHRYIRRQIDSRTVPQTNKGLFEKWETDWGEDSDFFKVRVRGMFPDQSALQLIPMSLVDENVNRDVHVTPADPLVFGVDVARFGDDESVIWARRGRDASVLGADESSPGCWRFQKLDTMQFAARIAALISEHRPDAVLVDGGGVGGGVIDRLRQMGHDPIEVNFGGKATQKGYANLRAQMWGNLKEALSAGIRLPDIEDLRTDLTSLEYGWNAKNDMQLESKEDAKKRGLSSPDLADALALTYVFPIARTAGDPHAQEQARQETDYDPI